MAFSPISRTQKSFGAVMHLCIVLDGGPGGTADTGTVLQVRRMLGTQIIYSNVTKG